MTGDKITSIRVRESTKKLLARQGVKGETYEDIILSLIRGEKTLISLEKVLDENYEGYLNDARENDAMNPEIIKDWIEKQRKDVKE